MILRKHMMVSLVLQPLTLPPETRVRFTCPSATVTGYKLATQVECITASGAVQFESHSNLIPVSTLF